MLDDGFPDQSGRAGKVRSKIILRKLSRALRRAWPFGLEKLRKKEVSRAHFKLDGVP